jgi:hypothetical protein
VSAETRGRRTATCGATRASACRAWGGDPRRAVILTTGDPAAGPCPPRNVSGWWKPGGPREQPGVHGHVTNRRSTGQDVPRAEGPASPPSGSGGTAPEGATDRPGDVGPATFPDRFRPGPKQFQSGDARGRRQIVAASAGPEYGYPAPPTEHKLAAPPGMHLTLAGSATGRSRNTPSKRTRRRPSRHAARPSRRAGSALLVPLGDHA